jgi:hypothetical protein
VEKYNCSNIAIFLCNNRNLYLVRIPPQEVIQWKSNKTLGELYLVGHKRYLLVAVAKCI